MSIPFQLTGRSVRATFLCLSLTFTISSAAFGHGGQIEVGGGSKSPVHLTASQEKSIGLKRVAADFRPLDVLLTLTGEVRLLPGLQAEISPRISGQVRAVAAVLGDSVKAGQPLARVQARLVGDPPPSVDVSTPITGIVDAVNVTLGQSVEPTTVLFHVSDRSKLNFVGRVYEEDLDRVRTGQAARVQLLSDPLHGVVGTVTLISPTLDPATRTSEVWIGIANQDGALRPNQFGHALLVIRQNPAALAIPTAAIIEANGEKFVFVHDGDYYKRVEITPGASDELYTEITDGLVPGDEVVTDGVREVYTAWLTGGKTPTAGQDD